MEWTAIWSQAMTEPIFGGMIDGKNRTTAFTIPAYVTAGKLRLTFSNLFGKNCAVVGAASVEMDGVQKPILFHDAASIEIPAGGEVVSDAVELPVTYGEPLTVRIYYPDTPTTVNYTMEDAQVYEGNICMQPTLPAAIDNEQRKQAGLFVAIPYLARVEAEVEAESKTIVAFGDSITAMNRWGAPLRDRICTAYPGQYQLLNAGISGNCLLYQEQGPMTSSFGEKATARFERDVLSVKHLYAVIIGLGINDAAYYTEENEKTINLAAYQAAITQMTEELHRRGVRVVMQTLTLRKGCTTGEFTDAMEQLRSQINAWIRSAGIFDYVFDAEAVVRDPQNPEYIADAYHQGDRLHPNALGGKLLADSYDLKKLLGISE